MHNQARAGARRLAYSSTSSFSCVAVYGIDGRPIYVLQASKMVFTLYHRFLVLFFMSVAVVAVRTYNTSTAAVLLLLLR